MQRFFALIALAVVLMVSENCFWAQKPDPSQNKPSVPKATYLNEIAVYGIIVEHQRSRWGGTGWGFAHWYCEYEKKNYTLIATVSHLVGSDFADMVGIAVSTVGSEGMYSVMGFPVVSFSDHDVAVIAVSGKRPVVKINLKDTAEDRPASGHPVYIISRPEFNNVYAASGRIMDYRFSNQVDGLQHIYSVAYSINTFPGTSGSPIISQDTGEAVALHWGSNGIYSLGVPLTELVPRLNMAIKLFQEAHGKESDHAKLPVSAVLPKPQPSNPPQKKPPENKRIPAPIRK